jgi:hypothetical protein
MLVLGGLRIYQKVVGRGRGIDRMVGELGRCRLVWRTGH